MEMFALMLLCVGFSCFAEAHRMWDEESEDTVSGTPHSALDTDSLVAQSAFVNQSTSCDPTDFVHLEIEHRGGMFGGRLAKQTAAKEKCDDSIGNLAGKGMQTATAAEGKTLTSKCHEGVLIGVKLCKQKAEHASSSDAPEEIINHFESARTDRVSGLVKWGDMATNWCSAGIEKKQWTHFNHCYHACQFLHVDCKQWTPNKCKLCGLPSKAGDVCNGVRGQNKNDAQGFPIWNNFQLTNGQSFLDACVMGCKAYVEKVEESVQEKGKGVVGYACKVGEAIKMKRAEHPVGV